MFAGSEGQPAVVYIDDDASARAAFEQAFRAEHSVVAISASALATIETQQVAVFVFDARTFSSSGEAERARLTGMHRHAARIVLTTPWQHDDVAKLLQTACLVWARSMAQARLLSHDLRTPLMSLLADAEHLSAVAEQVTSLREVADNMQRAARLVQQLVERLGI